MGGNQSKASADIDNAVKSSIKSVMDNHVKASVDVACTNQQIVVGANNCVIAFADQICDAIGTSNFAGSTTFSQETAQTIMNSITAKTDSMMSGLTPSVGNKSTSHIKTKNLVDMSVDTTQKFHTDCTRDVRGINTQSVTDCTESAIKFNPQTITAEVIGDCVVNASGEFKAVQDIKNVVDIAATATMKGVDLFGVIFLYLCIAVLCIIGGPMFVGRMKVAVLQPTVNLTPGERQVNKQRYVMIMVIMFTLIVSMVVWWPGIIAAKLKVWPYSYSTVDTDYDPNNPGAGVPMCQDGKNLNRATFVNEFMWYDPLCLSTPDKPCTTQTKQKHYEGCGVFATKSGCDDPRHTADRAAFAAILEACSDLAVANAKPKSCNVVDVATTTISTAAEYGSCMQCTDPATQRAGYWVKENGMCSVNTIHERAYLKQPGTFCDAGDVNCKNSEAELLQVSPEDCMDTLYQNDKKKVAYILSACDKIQPLAAIKTDPNTGLLPLLRYQCPPKADDYMLNCDASTGKCDYTAVSTDPYVIASCKNDLDGCCENDENGILVCNDKMLETDMDIYNHWNTVCYDRWAKAAKLSLAALITICVYVLLFGIMIFLIMRGQSGATGATGLQGNGSQTNEGQGVADANSVTSLRSRSVLCVAFLISGIIFGPPFGLLGVVWGTKEGKISIYSIYSTPKKDFDQATAKLVGIIGASISFAISFFLMLSVIFSMYNNHMNGQTPTSGIRPLSNLAQTPV